MQSQHVPDPTDQNPESMQQLPEQSHAQSNASTDQVDVTIFFSVLQFLFPLSESRFSCINTAGISPVQFSLGTICRFVPFGVRANNPWMSSSRI